jgi:uncharacterized protein (TIGR02265 family)
MSTFSEDPAAAQRAPHLASLRPSRSPEFVLPDFAHPLNVEAALRRIPAHATGKGMFAARILSELDKRGIERPTQQRFLPFADYSLRQCAEVNVEVARLLFPTAPLAQGLRQLAWLSLETFADTLLGQAIFGAVRRDVMAILKLSSKGLTHAANVGEYELQILHEHAAIMHCIDMYFFGESFGVGMLEGMLRACHVEGEVLANMDSPTRGAFYIEWRPRAR